MQIQLEKTLDVEVVERQLAELWKQTSGDVGPDVDYAVLRARVANLLVYVADDPMLTMVREIMAELTAMHPSRVLLMSGNTDTSDHDIEMSLETLCQTDKRTGAKRLCCEEVTLEAAGNFVSELPSAALPLVVSDLTTFLWWRASLDSNNTTINKVFDSLMQASARLIVDSADFADPQSDLFALTKLFENEGYSHVGISDLNWARLTSWRALLAGFYDVTAYQPLLNKVDKVRIDYLASEPSPELSPNKRENAAGPTSVSPQALLIAGWLASRLGWSLASERLPPTNGQTTVFKFLSGRLGGSPTASKDSTAHDITVELNRAERAEGKPGRLVSVELISDAGQSASFAVSRSADNLHLTTEARFDSDVHRGRVLPVRNRSAAQLLGREMEILCNDQIYQEALAVSARMIDRSKTLR